MKFKQSEVFKVCANIFEKFEDKSRRAEIVARFVSAGVPVATAYRYYARLTLGETQRKTGSGMSRSKLNSQTKRK